MSTNEKLLYVVAGTGIGAILGILFAPKSGQELRNDLASQAHRSADLITEKVDEGKRYIQDKGGASATVRSFVERGKQRVNAAIEAGKQQYSSRSEGDSRGEGAL